MLLLMSPRYQCYELLLLLLLLLLSPLSPPLLLPPRLHRRHPPQVPQLFFLQSPPLLRHPSCRYCVRLRWAALVLRWLLPHPCQSRGVAPERVSQSRLFHGQPCSRAHCSTARSPYRAAARHVNGPHGQSCSRTHGNTARCPPSAAAQHVLPFHGQWCCRAHRNTSRCPP